MERTIFVVEDWLFHYRYRLVSTPRCQYHLPQVVTTKNASRYCSKSPNCLQSRTTEIEIKSLKSIHMVFSYRSLLTKICVRQCSPEKRKYNTERKRFIVKNWLTQIWRLTSPNPQCGPAGWRPRRADGTVGPATLSPVTSKSVLARMSHCHPGYLPTLGTASQPQGILWVLPYPLLEAVYLLPVNSFVLNTPFSNYWCRFLPGPCPEQRLNE